MLYQKEHEYWEEVAGPEGVRGGVSKLQVLSVYDAQLRVKKQWPWLPDKGLDCLCEYRKQTHLKHRHKAVRSILQLVRNKRPQKHSNFVSKL